MKVGKVSRAGRPGGYIPLHDRIFSTIVAQANKARRHGKSEVSMMMKDSPALWKAIHASREFFEVHAERSNSVKVTVKL